jgi:DNA-binding IclR family transcriptional regulator
MQQTAITESGGLIQSIQRAVHLLKAFDDQGELGVTELSRLVGLPKSTVSRMLATLEHEGLVERTPASDKYRLGFLLVRLAGRVSHFRDLRAVAQPVLLELSERARETIHLAVPDGDEVVNIEQISGPHLVRETNWVGRRTPFHCAANGKALLAFQPAAAIEQVLAGTLARFTERTITERAQVRAELAQVRARGYARALGEIETGLNGVAAPVRNAGGEVIAAVSAGGPAYRVTSERMHELGALVVEAAATISTRLGYTI